VPRSASASSLIPGGKSFSPTCAAHPSITPSAKARSLRRSRIKPEALLAAMATMLAVGEIVGHEEFADLQEGCGANLTFCERRLSGFRSKTTIRFCCG
jgi:hypothetical protein